MKKHAKKPVAFGKNLKSELQKKLKAKQQLSLLISNQVNGFGLGFRPPHYKYVTEILPKSVDWFEIISENFFEVGGPALAYLEKLRANYPIAMHGVSLSIASKDNINFTYLKQLKKLVDQFQPAIVSDHYCWTGINNTNTHDLLPAPYTYESLNHTSNKIFQVQDYLKRPILLENPSMYVNFNFNEMTEVEFLTQLCKKTGCYLLLDVNNLFVNQFNIGIDPKTYIDNLPTEIVKQFHIAGHSEYKDVIIDTHSAPVREEVWHLYRLARQKWPEAPTLLEWDSDIPEFSIVEDELNKARKFNNKHIRQATTSSKTTSEAKLKKPHLDFESKPSPIEIMTNNLASIQQDFLEMVLQPSALTGKEKIFSTFGEMNIRPTRGAQVYNHAYFLRIHDVLADIFPKLKFVMEDDGFHDLVANYLTTYRSPHLSITYIAQDLPLHIRHCTLATDYGVPYDCLADLAQLEWTRLKCDIAENSSTKIFSSQELLAMTPADWIRCRFKLINATLSHFSWDIVETWNKIEEGEIPEKPEKKTINTIVFRNNNYIIHKIIAPLEYKLLQAIDMQQNFADTCEKLKPKDNDLAHHFSYCVQILNSWVELGVIASATESHFSDHISTNAQL